MRRGWLIAAILIGLAAIVVAAVAMRLSDDGGQSTEAWAEEVCVNLSDWRDSITSLADLGGEPLTAESLRDRLDDAESATSDLVAGLRELGAPDLEAGAQLEAELDNATAELESAFEGLKESAEAAADAPAGQLLANLGALGSAFATLQSAVGQVVFTLQNANVAEDSRAELQQAFAAAPSCESLRAES